MRALDGPLSETGRKMGDWRSPLGMIGLVFLFGVPVLLAGPTAAATLKMLENRKHGAPGGDFWMDRKAFDPARYTEEGLRHRSRAIRYRSWIFGSVLLGVAFLVAS